MKKTIALFVALVSFSCSKAQKKEFSTATLAEKVIAINGSEVSFQSVLDKYKGKTVLLEFWASWCGDCVKAMPKIKELQQNNPEVVYVFFSCDKTFDKWKDGIEKHELKGDHYLVKDGMKGTFGKSVDLDWIPRYIVVNKKSKISLYRAIETDFELIQKTLKD
jgi:thiol-disulfide isomerase/thioredoxin